MPHVNKTNQNYYEPFQRFKLVHRHTFSQITWLICNQILLLWYSRIEWSFTTYIFSGLLRNPAWCATHWKWALPLQCTCYLFKNNDKCPCNFTLLHTTNAMSSNIYEFMIIENHLHSFKNWWSNVKKILSLFIDIIMLVRFR